MARCSGTWARASTWPPGAGPPGPPRGRGPREMARPGIPDRPGCERARPAVEEGYLAGDRDLAEPAFYLSPLVSEAWMLDRVNRAIARCPGTVPAAQEGG